MDSYMAEDLLRWRRQSDYASDDDFVFASETMKGKQPYWPDKLMKCHAWPDASADGINKNIGLHIFRHLLQANEATERMSKLFSNSYGTPIARSRLKFAHKH
jgi:hypothetical protein